jgi:hypothetical protein
MEEAREADIPAIGDPGREGRFWHIEQGTPAGGETINSVRRRKQSGDAKGEKIGRGTDRFVLRDGPAGELTFGFVARFVTFVVPSCSVAVNSVPGAGALTAGAVRAMARR